VIEIQNVSKQFYTLKALEKVSLTIPHGEVIGLLGPNGAGKTTLIKLIAGVLFPSAGQIKPTFGAWPIIGYKPERLLYPNNLKVHEYLEVVAQLSNIPRAHVAAEVSRSLRRVGLQEAAQKKIKTCSKGMRQRLGLAQILIGDPPLLLVDEPSNGLDPEGQEDIIRCLQELHAAGKTIVMSSHQLAEVTEVCTQLIILNRGKVLYQNSMAEALAIRAHTMIKVDRQLDGVNGLLQGLHPEIEVEGDTIVLANEAMALRRHVLSILLHGNYDVLRVEQKSVTLAEIYGEAMR
jgi:ABC-type multidrug transport system ATPase subunit